MSTKILKLVVTLAVALGLSLTVVGVPTTAGAAPAAPSAGASSDVAPTAERACPRKTRKVALEKRQLAKAKKAFKKAKTKKQRAKAKRRVKAEKRQLVRARKQLRTCRNRPGPTDPPVTPEDPIRTLCDNGVPQPLCTNIVLVLNLLGGGGTGDSPISDFCEAFPQAAPLCEALEDGADPTTLIDLIEDVLRALGLPIPRAAA